MDIQETRLPGLGTRFDLTTRSSGNIGVIVHRDGRRDIFACDKGDPDCPSTVINLEPDECDVVADLLGADHIGERLHSTMLRVEGLAIEWLTIPPASPFIDRAMGDTQARSKTGVSIVAIVRDDNAIPSPSPEHVLHANDTLVVVGEPKGIKQLSMLLNG